MTLLRDLTRLWQLREVIYVLVARELKARYRGALLGFLWSFLNPLILMSVYVVVFSVYMRIAVDRYPAFLLAGMLPWMWFSASLGEANRALLDNRALVKKVALPAEIFPLVSIASNLVHFLLSLPILMIILLLLDLRVSWVVGLLPVVLAVQFAFTFGLALMCSALSVRFRDLLQLVPNVLAIWFFLSPVFYPLEMVPERFRPLVVLNPMAPLLGAYHDLLYYQRVPEWLPLAAVAALSAVLLAAGDALFNARREAFVEEM